MKFSKSELESIDRYAKKLCGILRNLTHEQAVNWFSELLLWGKTQQKQNG